MIGLASLIGLTFLFACTGQPSGEAPEITSFTASDRLLSPGDMSTLNWTVENATSLSVESDTDQDVGDVTGETSRDVPHTETTTHTLTATNAFGTDTATVTVNVITVDSAFPADIPVGAPAATLEDASAFAWQEFIALNWPAVAQTGAAGNREMPDASKPFGQIDPTLGTPLVWETFRHKVEIFPGTGTPHGGANYDALPQYVYNPAAPPNGVGATDGQVQACSVADPNTPWVNLDEQSEIGLDQMFAGGGPGTQFSGQQLLYMAKANRVEYDYVFQNGWYAQGSAPFAATIAYLAQNKASPPPGSTTEVSFPFGTVELKAAWRQLTPAELGSGRFHTATVRFYEKLESGLPCYQEAEWGLVALHIIQKTPTAPYFIYATFEQADNLLTSSGSPVEDENGNLVANQSANPLDPMIASQNATSANPPTPTSVQTLTPEAANATPPANLLYFENTPDNTSEPQGLVYLNKRIHDIPEAVIEANTEAHEAITAYNGANSLTSSPWLYYKLVNVQWQPMDKPTPGEDYTGDNAATYYQANIVVETDYNLQVFSGRFQPGNADNGTAVADPSNPSVTKNILGLITDFNPDGTPTKNVAYSGQDYNMGGCMGCHGNAQVLFGSDFSFILLGAGFNDAPEVGGPETPANLEKYMRLLLP